MDSTCSQVFTTRLVNLLLCLIVDAVILSSVSLLFIRVAVWGGFYVGFRLSSGSFSHSAGPHLRETVSERRSQRERKSPLR